MDLKQKARVARIKMLVLDSKLKEVRNQYEEAKELWEEIAAEIEKADYEEAMKDGRLKVVKSGVRQPPALTKAQIREIAEQLNITLTVKEEENES